MLVSGIVAAWVAVMVYELRLKSQNFLHLNPADAVRLINKGAVVLDIRKPEAYQAGHIVNARNVTLEQLLESDKVGKYRNKVVLAVCDNGLASNRAVTQLRKAGIEQAFSLQGGVARWRGDNLPLSQ